MGTSLLAALSMVEEKWSSTVRPVGRQSALNASRKDEKHHSHNYEELNEAFERYKGEIMSSLEPMEKQLMND